MFDKIDERWQGYNSNLDRVDTTNINAAVRTGYLQRTVSGIGSVAINEIRLLGDVNNLSVIEIGGGYGSYCEEFHKGRKVKDYTIVDTKSMLRFSKAYLKAKGIKCTFLDTEEELPDKEYDLLISNVCISEIPEDHAKQMLTRLFKQVKRVAIIDVEMKWLEQLLINNFGDYSKDSCTECNQSNHYIYKCTR
jgi:hypothetical protein